MYGHSDLVKGLDGIFPNELRGNVPLATYYDRFYGENRWRSLQVYHCQSDRENYQLLLSDGQYDSCSCQQGLLYTPHMY
jgi:hypothetical protein